jgi:DNA-binding GntR family transcriptional regulator
VFSSKKEIAKRRLTEAIISGEFEPGEYLRQNEIAARFKLSSTPVREAFAELQMIGVLVHEVHRGFRVADIDQQRVFQVFQLRKLIELEAARLAVFNVTENVLNDLKDLLADMERQKDQGEFLAMIHTNDSFHRMLFSLSGNGFLVDAIERLWNNLPRFAAWSVEGRRHASIVEHANILKAFCARDPHTLIEAYTVHLTNAEAAFYTLINQKLAKT